MLARDVANLALGARLERVWQHVDPNSRTARVRGHRVGQALELGSYDDDRRLPLVRDLDGVVDAPRGAAASVPEADEGDVDVGRELGELLERLLAFVPDPVPRLPQPHLRAGLS